MSQHVITRCDRCGVVIEEDATPEFNLRDGTHVKVNLQGVMKSPEIGLSSQFYDLDLCPVCARQLEKWWRQE